MPTREDLFPSKYLKAADLNGKPAVVEIEKAPSEKLKGLDGTEQVKTVLYFKGAEKSLPLNMTNWDLCAAICGDDTDDWAGHAIELYPTTTMMGGKAVACIRIRKPSKKPSPGVKLPPKKPVLPVPPPEDPDDPGFTDDDMREREDVPF
jgi:hypothetical protein